MIPKLVSVISNRLPVNLPQLLEEWRSLIVTVLELWHFVKSGSTRRVLSFWSGNCHSRDWFVRLPKISRLIFVSRVMLCWLFKRLPRLTLWVYLRILTSAPSMPSVWPSCPRTFNLLVESGVNVHKLAFSSFFCNVVVAALLITIVIVWSRFNSGPRIGVGFCWVWWRLWDDCVGWWWWWWWCYREEVELYIFGVLLLCCWFLAFWDVILILCGTFI